MDIETITAIRSTPRDPSWVSVKVGRRVAAKLPAEDAHRMGLRVGMVWDAALESRVRPAEGRATALRDALKLLRRRAYGSSQLGDKLRGKGHDPRVVAEVVRALIDRGALDDEQFGRLVVQGTLARKAAGRRLLTQRLYQKRVPRDVADRVVEAALSTRDLPGDARALAMRRLDTPTFDRLDPASRKRRLWGLLARRGFDAETIEAALRGLPGLGE